MLLRCCSSTAQTLLRRCSLTVLQLYTALYYVPFYLMSVRSTSPVRAGIDLFPAVCLLVPGSVVVAMLTSRLGHFRWSIWLGLVVATIGCGLFALFDERTAKAVFAVALAVFGVGNGMVLTGVNVGTQAIAKAEDRPMAACMYGFMRSLGMPVGVAVRSLNPDSHTAILTWCQYANDALAGRSHLPERNKQRAVRVGPPDRHRPRLGALRLRAAGHA